MYRSATLRTTLAMIMLVIGNGCRIHRITDPQTVEYGFESGTDGWEAGFSDYRPEHEEKMALRMAHAALPDYLAPGLHGLNLSGHNLSADLFMFVKRRIEDLQARVSYNVMFEIEIASNALEGIYGIGGGPGSSVYLKAGASPVEPAAINSGTYLHMNIDKGNQAQSGSDAVVLGTIGIGNNTPGEPYRFKTLSSARPMTVTADASGALWILVGIDAAFEGRTEIFINKITITVSPYSPTEDNV